MTVAELVRPPASPKHLFEEAMPAHQVLFAGPGTRNDVETPPGFGARLIWHEWAGRRRTPQDRKDARRPRGISRSEHLSAGQRLREAWDIAQRGINGQEEVVRFNADRSPESYAGVSDAAAEHPKLADHNYFHERRVTRLAEALLFNIGEVRHLPHIIDFLPAAASFAPRHDRVQLLRQHDNLGKPKDEQLKPKFTHATGGAILDLLEMYEYARATGVSLGRAREIKAASAVMIMKHDEPERLGEALGGMVDARTVPGDQLLDHFNSNKLDLTTLTPALLLKIHREEASKAHGFVTAETPNGLPRVIEEHYADRIAALAQDDTPLLPLISAEQRVALNTLTEVVVVADVMDMIIPPEEALIRTLLVPRSMNRPFFKPEVPTEELVDLVLTGSGNQPEEIETDTLRILWESAHALEMFPDGVVSESAYGNRVIGKAVLQGVMALGEIGTYLLEGRDLDAEDSPINRIYDRRIKNLGEKAMRKANISKRTRDSIAQGVSSTGEGGYENLVVSQLTEFGAVAERFTKKVDDLNGEKRKLVESLLPKQVRVDGQPFTSEDIAHFQHSVQTILDTLVERYNVSSSDLNQYRAELADGIYTAPYSSYDSLAQPWQRRTVFPTSSIVNGSHF